MTKTSNELLKEKNANIEHAKQIEEYSTKLFDALNNVVFCHSEKEKKYLIEASRLHDIGYFIEKKSHHKHSMNIILEEGLDGYNEYETQIIANIARYHRGSFPNIEKHKNYASLQENDQQLVKELSSILRISDGMDKPHKNLILRMRAENEENQINLYLKTIGFKPNLKMAEKKKELFEETFNKKLVFFFE